MNSAFYPLQPATPWSMPKGGKRRGGIRISRSIDDAKRCVHLSKERHYDFEGSRGALLYFCDQKHKIRPDRYSPGAISRIWVSNTCVKCPFWSDKKRTQTTLPQPVLTLPTILVDFAQVVLT